MKEKLGYNPWFTMWVKPRMTIQGIIEYNTNFRLWWISFFYGLVCLFSFSQSFSVGFALSFSAIIIISIIVATIWGYVIFSIASFFVYFIGKWFKGLATFKQIRCAFAWSNVPIVLSLIIWVIMLFLYKIKLFKDFKKAMPLDVGNMTLLIILMLIQFALSIWSLVLYINALAQVQQYSIIRSIINIIIASLFIFVIMVGILFLIGLAIF